jgi:hypothetical protein
LPIRPSEADFDAIRDREDFKRLVAELDSKRPEKQR